MNKIFAYTLVLCLGIVANTVQAQSISDIPAQTLVDLQGNEVSSETLIQEGKPTIVSFWATWCAPCLSELKNIAKSYATWQEESGVNLVAISIDHPRKLEAVKNMVAKNEWKYQVYMDQGGAYRKALNVVNVPHTFLIDAKGNIVYQSTSYKEGDELKLYEQVKAAQAD